MTWQEVKGIFALTGSWRWWFLWRLSSAPPGSGSRSGLWRERESQGYKFPNGEANHKQLVTQGQGNKETDGWNDIYDDMQITSKTKDRIEIDTAGCVWLYSVSMVGWKKKKTHSTSIFLSPSWFLFSTLTLAQRIRLMACIMNMYTLWARTIVTWRNGRPLTAAARRQQPGHNEMRQKEKKKCFGWANCL